MQLGCSCRGQICLCAIQKDEIGNIYQQQYKQMETTQNILTNFFKPASEEAMLEKQKNQVLCELEVSFQKYKNHKHKLILTNNYLFLCQIVIPGQQTTQSKVYCTKLEFQVKFQIQSALQNDRTSQKMGIIFYCNTEKKITLYTFNELGLIQMRKKLSKKINQRGFHSMYVPTKKLGKGNFATVYEVVRLEDGQKFAVKAYSKQSIYSGENGKEGLINQLAVMRQISGLSPNLLTLYQIFQSDNSIYAVLELIEGKNITEILKKRPAGFNYQQSRVLLKGLLNAIHILNTKKLMHRDLKPENILVRTENLSSPSAFDPVLVDFGMATNYTLPMYIFVRCGTPGFVAPEVANLQVDGPYSPICDVFSIGCLFHLFITGRRIFQGELYDDILLHNKMLKFQIRKNRVQNCHPKAMDLLMRMLEGNPRNRISIGDALRHDFFGDQKMYVQTNLHSITSPSIPKQQVSNQPGKNVNIIQQHLKLQQIKQKIEKKPSINQKIQISSVAKQQDYIIQKQIFQQKKQKFQKEQKFEQQKHQYLEAHKQQIQKVVNPPNSLLSPSLFQQSPIQPLSSQQPSIAPIAMTPSTSSSISTQPVHTHSLQSPYYTNLIQQEQAKGQRHGQEQGIRKQQQINENISPFRVVQKKLSANINQVSQEKDRKISKNMSIKKFNSLF